MKELREANITRDKEWAPDGNITLSFRGVELAGEVGEACNLLKKLERERLGIRGSRTNTNEVGKELADVIICVDLIAMQLGINLDEYVRHKFNETSTKYGLKTKMATS